MRKFQIDGPIRTLQLNPDVLRLLHVLAFDVNGNLFRVAAYDAKVSIVQVQTKVRTRGQIRLKCLMLEIRGLGCGLAEPNRGEQQRNR
jgi:hypothetical protein